MPLTNFFIPPERIGHYVQKYLRNSNCPRRAFANLEVFVLDTASKKLPERATQLKS